MTRSVAQNLARERERLAELERERAGVLAAIGVLEQQAAAAAPACSEPADVSSVQPADPVTGVGRSQVATTDGRVALFASLFRGRPDVFARRWQNRVGRSGWSPRCTNEWVTGVCEKPRVKCAACEHQRFVPFSQAQARRHLEGRETLGIYPLMADKTCWLVAIDLDGASWREDALAVRAAAVEHDVPVLVERSRSGEGAHIWILFSAPVRARAARTLASWLLTEAMRRQPMSMASYDRLFPNQDTMPAGGFGSLIALPLQLDARKRGCTVFLDEALEPYADQWEYLCEVRRLQAGRVQELAAAAERSGGALGLPQWDGDELARAPMLSSGQRGAISHPLPSTVAARLAGRLELAVDTLPAALVDRLRRSAAFANPAFYERERARLSTHRTPRVIACHERIGERVLLPRGCRDAVEAELAAERIALEIEDARTDGSDLDLQFRGQLSGAQEAATAAMSEHEIGVLVAPPGAGKTVMAASLIARRGRSTLVLVHRRPLLDQWVQRLSSFLDLDAVEIGVVATGGRGASGRIDVAMLQSLAQRKDLEQALSRYGHLVVDECHHVPAVSVERVLRRAPARFMTGLTATPRRRDGHHPIIAMQCGPVRHLIKPAAAGRETVRRLIIERRTPFDRASLPPEPGIQEILGAIAADPSRTELITSDAVAALSDGRAPLVLTERRGHLEALAAKLDEHVPRLIILHGSLGVRDRRRAAAELAQDEPRVVLATGRYIGEGFDDARLDTLLLAMPIAWSGTITQYAGRLHRDHDDKTETRILDYVDHDVPVLRRMFAKRLRAYRKLGYEVS